MQTNGLPALSSNTQDLDVHYMGSRVVMCIRHQQTNTPETVGSQSALLVFGLKERLRSSSHIVPIHVPPACSSLPISFVRECLSGSSALDSLSSHLRMFLFSFEAAASHFRFQFLLHAPCLQVILLSDSFLHFDPRSLVSPAAACVHAATISPACL